MEQENISPAVGRAKEPTLENVIASLETRPVTVPHEACVSMVRSAEVYLLHTWSMYESK